MKRPRPKKISSLSPGLVRESIPSILLQLQDKLYDDPPPCPRCRSEERKRHGQRKHIYATIITEKGFQKIFVRSLSGSRGMYARPAASTTGPGPPSTRAVFTVAWWWTPACSWRQTILSVGWRPYSSNGACRSIETPCGATSAGSGQEPDPWPG